MNIDALRFAFDIVRRGTLASGAALEVSVPPLLLRCTSCEAEYLTDPEELDCPVCGERQFEILQGAEMRLCSITGDPAPQTQEETA